VFETTVGVSQVLIQLNSVSPVSVRNQQDADALTMWNRFPSKPLCDQIQMRRPCGKYYSNMDMWALSIVAHRYESGALQARAAASQCFRWGGVKWLKLLSSDKWGSWRFHNVLKTLLLGNCPDSPCLLLTCGRQIPQKLKSKPGPFRALGLIQTFRIISRLVYAFVSLRWFGVEDLCVQLE